MPCNHELMNEFSPGTGTAHWVVPEASPPQAQLSVENLRFQLVGSVPSWYPSRLHHTLGPVDIHFTVVAGADFRQG